MLNLNLRVEELKLSAVEFLEDVGLLVASTTGVVVTSLVIVPILLAVVVVTSVIDLVQHVAPHGAPSPGPRSSKDEPQ